MPQHTLHRNQLTKMKKKMRKSDVQQIANQIYLKFKT